MKMRRSKLVWLAVFALLLLTGCASRSNSGDGEVEEPGYSVFYLNTDRNALVEKKYLPQGETFDEILMEVLEVMETAPDETCCSAFPDGTGINSYIKLGENVTIDLNAGFLSASNVEKVMFEAALIKTVAMLPGVYNVSITVESQPLSDDFGEVIPALNEESFIDSQSGSINSYRKVTMTVYFPDKAGKVLVPESRTAYFNSNVSTERAVVEQVIRGPFSEGCIAAVPQDVQVRSVRISDNICVIDFDDSINNAYSYTADPEICLYAFVNTICEVCKVNEVQFEIGGEKNVLFRDAVSFEKSFQYNKDIIMIQGQEIIETATEEQEQG